MSLGVYWFELYYHAQREETLSRYDMLALVDPLTTLSLISILYPAERDPRIWAATGLACLVLYVGHKNHHTVQFDQGERWLLTAIGIGAVIVSIQRYLLSFYSEPALNALYTTGIASLFLWRYGLGWLRTAYRFRREFLLTAALIVSNSVLFLYSYQRFGVTLTTMISLLQPVLVAFVAYFILKEPVKPKLLVAGSAVLLIVMVTVAIVHPH